MSVFREVTGKNLPRRNVILPLQYPRFGELAHCIMFVSMQKQIGVGAAKRVNQILVNEIIGSPPIEITALKKKSIVLYRPRESDSDFINDVIAIVKLSQRQIKHYNALVNIGKLKGHSLYIHEEYKGVEIDYSKLLYEGYLKFAADKNIFSSVVQSALKISDDGDLLDCVVEELLQTNQLLSDPFMLGDVLPFSLGEAFSEMSSDLIVENVYQMLYTIVAYAKEGVYFRDLQPDNFRTNHKYQVKLTDPAYIDSSVTPENRYVLFIKQTTPEYLPNAFSFLSHKGDSELIKRYFGEFTDGVSIGMLERVLRRIFLPKYMGSRYDSLYKKDSNSRIQAAEQLKFQEDLDFFRDVINDLPSAENFATYQKNLADLMKREEVVPENLQLPLSQLLTVLRQFSYPLFRRSSCDSLLSRDVGKNVGVDLLPTYAKSVLQIEEKKTPVKTPPPKTPTMLGKASRATVSKQAPTSQILRGESPKSWHGLTHEKKPATPKTQIRGPINLAKEFKGPKSWHGLAHTSKLSMGEKARNRGTARIKRNTLSSPIKTMPVGNTSGKRENISLNVSPLSSKRSAASPSMSTRKLMRVPTNQEKSASPPTATEISNSIDTIFEFVNELPAINIMLQDSPTFAEVLRKRLHQCLANNMLAIAEIKLFFLQTNAVWENPDFEMMLFHLAQSLVPHDVYKTLHENVPPDYGYFYRARDISIKCKNMLSQYLVFIAKIRFLTNMDSKQEAASFLPQPNQNLLDFICEHDWRCSSLAELAKIVVKDIF